MDENAKKEDSKSNSLGNKIYDDVIQPTAKEFGQIFSLVPRALRVILSKFEKWIINGEYSIKETEKILSEKLKNVDENKIVDPEPYVAIPAIQQLSYCMDNAVLREMYANLIAASMNSDTKWKVHPSFVDIIRQLNPDEAKLLQFLSKNPCQPFINVNHYKNNIGYIEEVSRFTIIGESICEYPKSIGTYLDNLERLNLISFPPDVYLVDDKFYAPLINHHLIKAYMEVKLPEGERMEIGKGKFVVTSFGAEFIKVCLS